MRSGLIPRRHTGHLGAVVGIAMMTGLWLALFVVALLMASRLAHAGATNAVTVGTSSAQCLAANTGPGYRLIVIDNESATATIAFNVGGTAALNTAGSITLYPSVTLNGADSRIIIAAPPNTTMHDPINCIASGASTPATILAW